VYCISRVPTPAQCSLVPVAILSFSRSAARPSPDARVRPFFSLSRLGPYVRRTTYIAYSVTPFFSGCDIPATERSTRRSTLLWNVLGDLQALHARVCLTLFAFCKVPSVPWPLTAPTIASAPVSPCPTRKTVSARPMGYLTWARSTPLSLSLQHRPPPRQAEIPSSRECRIIISQMACRSLPCNPILQATTAPTATG
jgi:hypothetical protein